MEEPAPWQEEGALPQRPWVYQAWEALARNKLALIGTLVTLAFLLIGIAGLVMLGVPSLRDLYARQDLISSLQPPLSGRLLGTDHLGRDLMARLVAGIGVSLAVAMVVTFISLVVGLTLGVLSGYYGGQLDLFISGLADMAWGFPIILLSVVLTGMFQPGLKPVIWAMVLVNWAGFARVARGEALTLREREFVKAAQALGVPQWKIILRHIVPNVMAPTLVLASYFVPVAIIAEAGLSFIGLGAQPPVPSLGQILADGRNYLSIDHWLVTIPGALLAIVALGLNALGDGLRDILDPRLRDR